MRRHNLLTAHGALVLHFTPSEIRYRRRSVRGTVERACAERAGTGVTIAIRMLSAPGSQPGASDPA
jgi:hypothetical protein